MMKLIPASLAFALALPCFAQQTAQPGDAAQQLLSHPANAQAQFLTTNSGWQAVSTQPNALLFQDPKSAKRGAVLGNITHQDPTTGAWTPNDASLSSTGNGWRLDGAAYSVFVRQSGATQHVVSQSYTDYASKHASTLNFTVPTLTYSKGFTFGFTQDGLAWNLIFSSAGFFQIRSVVSKRIGKVTHSFPVSSSESLTIDSLGELIGDTYVGLTRAIMIPRYGKPVQCSPWSYAKGVASFTCDDSVLKDNQLPYRIDPQSQVTLTDNGTYGIDDWNDGNGNSGSDVADVHFNTGAVIPSPSTIQGAGCNYNIVDSDEEPDDGVQCFVYTPYNYNGVTIVEVGIQVSGNGFSWSDSATVNEVQVTVWYTPPPPAATPSFSLGSGTYSAGTTVSLSTATSGASINYTTDGSTPSGTSGIAYTGPITLNAPTLINAVAYGSQWGASSVASATYNVQVATPTISPGGGLYTSAQSITLGFPNTAGSGWNYELMMYTTDGSTPGPVTYYPYSNGTVYDVSDNPPNITAPLNATTTVKVIGIPRYAASPPWAISGIASVTYTVTGTVATPTFSVAAGTYISAQSVTLSSSASGATIRYTTDGSAPTETHGTVYGGAISVANTTTIKAIAYKANWADSAVASAAYTITGTIATPTLAISGGNCVAGLGGQVCSAAPTITLSTTSSGASIRYTFDGVTTPTETNGTLYQQPFALNSTSNTQATTYTVQAIAYESTWADSAVASLKVTITGTVSAPVFTPAGGIYSAAQSIALSAATSGATIRYTTDGSAPTESHGTIYASPIPVTAQTTIKAIAYEAYWLDSAVTGETYYFSSPTGGTGSGGGAGSGTPPADSGNGLDPRRVGIRALGSYWGDAGENLDTISGNLSFANPLIKPLGRGGWSLPFMLSYNSQMWRHDSAGDWLLGQDVGYGMGWKLQAGSLTPVWSSTSAIDHYIFTDASGAEYNLTVNNGGVWTSTEGTYITYDSNANKLYNSDGSFWYMGCVSAGSEQDAGTMYPTQVEDSNGNQILISYAPAQGLSANDTSARISAIYDPRAGYQPTYFFTYSTISPNDDIQHLTAAGGVAGESWIFTYASSSLSSPISGASYGSTEALHTIQQNNEGAGQPPAAVFAYNTAAEMTQYTTAMGGSISWGYRNFTYAGNIELREVNTRSMNQGAGGFTNTHSLTHNDSADASLTYHSWTAISDTGAASEKLYGNGAPISGTNLIGPTSYQEIDPSSAILLQKTFTWAQGPAGNPYIGTVATALNPGTSGAVTTSTVQTLNAYGNLTQQQAYDYGSSTVSRTYNLTYITDGNYTSRYIRNRMTTATVTVGNAITQLAAIYYDGQAGPPNLYVPPPIAPLQAPTGVTLTSHDSAYDVNFLYRGNPTLTWRMGANSASAYQITGIPYEMQDGDGMTVTTAPGSSTAYSLPSALTPNGNSNLATSFTYSSSFAVTSLTGPNGAGQTIDYDGYNRPGDVRTADGALTVFAYAFAPSPNTQTATINNSCPPATQCGSSQTAATQWKTTTFDGFGRTIKVQTGYGSTIVNTVDTVYGACGCSPLGKVIKVSMPYGPSETEVWTTYTYDGSGRQLTSTAPDGSVTTTVYSGNTVTTTDPAGVWKKSVSDAFGNLLAVYEPDPATGSATTGPATNYTYNGANQLTNVSMTRGSVTQTRTFTYSGSDLASETTPEAGAVTYTYDGNHHVLTRIDAKNQKTQYTYDAYERLIAVQHYTWGNAPNCTTNCVPQWNEQSAQDVNYYYDTPVANDYTQNYTWGRLSGVAFSAQQAPAGTFYYEYSYNQAGRVTGNRMLMTTSGNGYVDLQAQYAWDNQGRMTSMTYPSGPVMNYQFDAMGRPITMTETASGPGTWTAGAATYGSAGQILTLAGSVSLGWGGASIGWTWGGTYETRSYNSMLQLTHLTNTGIDMQYIYPAGQNNGRVSQTIDNVLGETVNYTYDYLHRLTGAAATSGSWGEAYTDDGFGNLTAKRPTQGSAPSYTAGSLNPATNSPGAADANGDLTAYQWDIENRPMTLGSTSYLYDPWGRRVWKQVYSSQYGTTACEVYFYGATGQKLETDTWVPGSSGSGLVGINTYFGGKMLSEKGVAVNTDRLGSVRANSNGESFSYFPWGEERGQGTADNRTKFAGYYRDMPGQDYAMARYYSASNGSFWSPDPGGMKTADSSTPVSWNRYPYANGDPVNRSDPGGMEVDSPCGPGWESDPSLQGPCCDPSYNSLLGAAPDPACYASGGGSAVESGTSQGDDDDPCDGIKQAISDTINGVGMPGDKSLLTRVVQQITGDPALFKGHQNQIDGYRNRLRKLKKDWKNDDCPDPDNPPYGTNEWIADTSGSNLKNLMDKYQQAVKDLQNLGIGAAAAAALAQAAQILGQIVGVIGELGGMVPVIVP